MQLPILEQHTPLADGGQCYRLRVPSGHSAFAGHFPNHPVLPGVVQLQWALHYAAQHWPIAPVAQEYRVKFTKIITPEMPLQLTLHYNPGTSQLTFAYTHGDERCAQGTLHTTEAA